MDRAARADVVVPCTWLSGNRWSFKPEIGVSRTVGPWTLSLPVDRYNSVKLYASSGVSDRTGNDFDGIGIAWQHRRGAGL
jgi:hypothetical protein